MNRTTEGLLLTAPVDWQDRADRIINKAPGIEYLPPVKDRDSLQEVIRELDNHIESAVRLRGYLDMRMGYGCGDQGHTDGVKESNRLVAKVRKVLGFTQARHDIRF